MEKRIEKIRILIVDDHIITRDCLKKLLSAADDMVVAGESACDEEVLVKVRQQEWDVVLLDLPVWPHKGLDLIRQVRHLKPKLPIFVLNIHDANQYVQQTLLAGATGYLAGNCGRESLVAVTRHIAAKGTYIDADETERSAHGNNPAVTHLLPHNGLSKREFQIFLMIVAGNRPMQLAKALGLSAKTVNTHKSRIFRKMGMTNSSELVHYAMMHGLVE